jgi:hypothetical protein
MFRCATPGILAGLTSMLLAGCGPVESEPEESAPAAAVAPTLPPPDGLPASFGAGWQDIEPGGETTCSDGSPYRFFARRGDPEKLLVYFQGGGACWNAETCDLHLDPSYKPTVAENELDRYQGIFDFDNPENPFADYSVVVAPYCTGDVHIGNNVATYQAPARDPNMADERDDNDAPHPAHDLAIHHAGVPNAEAVLAWTYERFQDPERIFVTGSSAGAIPSPYYAWRIADHYPQARLAQLGDGAGGYRRGKSDPSDRLSRWGALEHLSRYPEFADVTEPEFTYEALYVAAAKRHPDVLFAEYDAAEDATQRRFLAMSGNDTESLRELLLANHADIRDEVGNFRVYVGGGDSHTILARPEFYTLHVDGMRVRDWVAAMADFQPVQDVVCNNCDEAEHRGAVAAEGDTPEGS